MRRAGGHVTPEQANQVRPMAPSSVGVWNVRKRDMLRRREWKTAKKTHKNQKRKTENPKVTKKEIGKRKKGKRNQILKSEK